MDLVLSNDLVLANILTFTASEEGIRGVIRLRCLSTLWRDECDRCLLQRLAEDPGRLSMLLDVGGKSTPYRCVRVVVCQGRTVEVEFLYDLPHLARVYRSLPFARETAAVRMADLAEKCMHMVTALVKDVPVNVLAIMAEDVMVTLKNWFIFSGGSTAWDDALPVGVCDGLALEDDTLAVALRHDVDGANVLIALRWKGLKPADLFKYTTLITV